jgi:hypothetical protein
MQGRITVDGYSGYKADERPVAFSLGKKTLRVTTILDRWYGPDHTYFKVLAEDSHIYIVRYHQANDQWELIFFKAGDYSGETSRGLEDACS